MLGVSGMLNGFRPCEKVGGGQLEGDGILDLRLGRRIRDPDVNHHLSPAPEHLVRVLLFFTRDSDPALRTQGWVA